MEHPALIEEVAVFGSEALGSADRLRVAANTLGVMDRVPVACLDRTSKGEQHSLRRIEPLIQRALPEQHLGADEQLLRVEGLAQVVVRSGSEAAELRFPIARCREDDDRDEPMDGVGLELFAHRYAVEPRHVDVEKDEIRLLSRDRIERLDAIFCLAQVLRGDRLREELVKARGLRSCDLLGEDRRAEGDDRHAQAAGAKASTDREAVLLRELYVEEDEVELIGGALFASRAVPLGHDLVAVSLERRLEELDIHRIVLNEENAQTVPFR